jgi:hypothetical protein
MKTPPHECLHYVFYFKSIQGMTGGQNLKTSTSDREPLAAADQMSKSPPRTSPLLRPAYLTDSLDRVHGNVATLLGDRPSVSTRGPVLEPISVAACEAPAHPWRSRPGDFKRCAELMQESSTQLLTARVGIMVSISFFVRAQSPLCPFERRKRSKNRKSRPREVENLRRFGIVSPMKST